METVKVKLNKYYEQVICSVRLKPECLADIMKRNESELIDWDCSDPPMVMIYGKTNPHFGFCECWHLKQEEDGSVLFEFDVGKEIEWHAPKEVRENPLNDLDVMLAALQFIKKHIKPEEILMKERSASL